MTNEAEAPAAQPQRVDALDALRGLAVLGMILSGQLPFGEHALPSWMYHAQVPPPEHKWIGTLPGITWVDVVLPFFLFAMGASIPLALSRRVERGVTPVRLAVFIVERGVLLGFFALYVQAIRPYVISDHPSASTWLIALLGFGLLLPILTRLPAQWPKLWRVAIRTGGWLGALLLLALLRYPDGSGFSLGRSDIIIVVLANMAVFGSFAWWLTRTNVLLRLGIVGILLAIRLSNMPQPTEGWVHDIWQWSPVPWIYKLYYLQYLCIVIPGTISGDLLLKWARQAGGTTANPAWSPGRHLTVAFLTVLMTVCLLVGLKARWLIASTVGAFCLCATGAWLLSRPPDTTARLLRDLFYWAIYWLLLGLFFEPYEGGIKKDRATVSYYFVTSGLAICLLVALITLLDVLKAKRWAGLLIDNGQNPMIAYAGINNFVIPVLALTGGVKLLALLTGAPWLGFLRGVIITLLLAGSVSVLTRRKIFWRT